MVHVESNDSNSFFLVHHSFLDFLGYNFDSFGGEFFVQVPTNVNVSLEGLLQVVHHLLGPFRSPNPKGNLSAKDPSGQVQIRNANQMVGV